jgi:1-acyl-sn-glycerol-3-phosphate acyltransferase
VGRLQVAGRLTRLGAHIGAGFVLGVASGAMFVQHLPFQQPVIRYWHRRMCKVLNLDIRVHGQAGSAPGLVGQQSCVLDGYPGHRRALSGEFLSKAEVADWPVVGHLARAAGTLYIKRGSGDANGVSSQMAAHLQAGRSVLFFPEGTTTDGRQLKTFFHKLFQAACVTGADIQPVVLCYRDELGQLHSVAPFIGDDEFTDHLMKVLKEKPMQVELLVLPRVSVDGRDARALSKHLRQLMAEGLERLHQGLV